MADVVITPEHLDHLAAMQDQASESAQVAGSTGPSGTHVSSTLMWTHGGIFAISNMAFGDVVHMRNQSIERSSTATAELAAKLRGAREAYQVLDQQLAENLDKQLNACPPDTSPES